ncbi:MAG: EAL domain-containing protein [Chloroflexi bacterium]|nr:EAL domain-containing protein [Chloroflexota bacterium]
MIVRTIVNLAHNLNMDVIAEGIETESQLDRLKALGCEYGQGFLFSKAVPAEEATAILEGKVAVAA